jgi:hypothetical protein
MPLQESHRMLWRKRTANLGPSRACRKTRALPSGSAGSRTFCRPALCLPHVPPQPGFHCRRFAGAWDRREHCHFSAMDTVLWKALPVADPHSLVRLSGGPRRNFRGHRHAFGADGLSSRPMFARFRRRSGRRRPHHSSQQLPVHDRRCESGLLLRRQQGLRASHPDPSGRANAKSNRGNRRGAQPSCAADLQNELQL